MKTRGNESAKSMMLMMLMVIIFLSVSFTLQSGKKQMPEPDGQSLWEYIDQENNYAEWTHWPGHEGMYEGQSPHGAYLKLFINEPAKAALDNGDRELPVDAILVKENYNENRELVAVTPMYKVKGYNPAAGDWFWAKYELDGKILAEGKVNGCIECHTKASEQDFVFSFSENE